MCDCRKPVASTKVSRVILAGDVGGTKTRLALYAPDASPRSPSREHRVASRDYPSLEAIVLEFLGDDRSRVSGAAIGIAGPVVENHCETTNLPWSMSGASLGLQLGGPPVRLINDLEATGWGLAHLEPTELRELQQGKPSRGNRALIAAGTGLGEALLIWDGAAHRPTASEGGHVDFASRNAFEDELSLWLRAKYQRVSYERVLSGAGLADLYRFLSATSRGAESAAMAEAFATAQDPPAVVSAAALDGSCERAVMALDHFVRIYAAEAGNLALKTLSVNGLFIGGGIGPRIATALTGGAFIDSFCDKGRLAPVLRDIPVHLILDDHTALWGAAAFAMMHLSQDRSSPTI